MLNKGYAPIDYVATPTCMVKVARSKGGVTGNETSERVKYSHEIERAKLIRSAR